jgi:hypothetical protein
LCCNVVVVAAVSLLTHTERGGFDEHHHTNIA